ncbi:MAG TPA: alpha/beta hydrolase-fold protein [Chloroflexota bacterium]|nr:alpha/beta hydrolase-fold protein [Chloroflexota bacterium]
MQRRLGRRRLLGTAIGAAGGIAALGGALPGGEALAAPKAQGAALVALPPGAAPLDGAGRRDLALDALTFLVRQQGVFPGRWIYQLPAPGWLGGYDARSAAVTWDVTVPGSTPIYLLAHAAEGGDLDAGSVSVSADGVPVVNLGAYVERGVPALWGGKMRELAVLGLVFVPPPPGTYVIEVRTRAGSESVATYRVTVQPADAFGPILLREPSGATYALAGHERRLVPDEATRRTLGYGPTDIRGASPELLTAMPVGAPVPALSDGATIISDGARAPFLLQGGKRLQLRPDMPDNAHLVDRLTLQTIVPELVNGTVLHGALPDVYQVDRQSLRKVPSWKWFEEKGIALPEPIYVPDRIISTLPQNSPHWVMPGGVRMDRFFQSEALGRSMPYRLYLPPDYATSGLRYPVIYLLHGQSGRYDEWSGYGVEEVANGLLNDGKLGSVIMIAPQGGLGYWMNQDGGALGGTKWGDYLAKELVRHVDATYRTVAKREGRAIGGLSMGGHGALQLGLNYPDTFGTVGAHSPSIRPEGSAPAFFGTGAFFETRDPISLVERSEIKPAPRLWIDAGTNDPWRTSAQELHKALEEKGWAHEWRTFSGEHDGWYWGDHLWEYLPFYGGAFAAAGVPGRGM